MRLLHVDWQLVTDEEGCSFIDFFLPSPLQSDNTADKEVIITPPALSVGVENPMSDLFVTLSVSRVPPQLSVCGLKKQQQQQLLAWIRRCTHLVALSLLIALAKRSMKMDVITAVVWFLRDNTGKSFFSAASSSSSSPYICTVQTSI